MVRSSRGSTFSWLLALAALTALEAIDQSCWLRSLNAQAVGRSFELSDAVQLDRAEPMVMSQLERVKACLADHQWEEAAETLGRLAESSDGKLLGVSERRYVCLRDYLQMQIASLPPEALVVYRRRIDPVAQKWYEAGIARRDRKALENVVDRAFASSFGDKALMALGEIALESGDYAKARWCWERILPNPTASNANAPAMWPNYPDTKLDVAAIRARLVLASILEGSLNRAKTELDLFSHLHPNAVGRLGGREVKYAEALASLLNDSASWPTLLRTADWLTFAGNGERNKVAEPLVDIGAVAWRTPLNAAATKAKPINDSLVEPRSSIEELREPLCFMPVVVGTTLFVNDQQTIRAFRSDRGEPAWGTSATIYHCGVHSLENGAPKALSPLSGPLPPVQLPVGQMPVGQMPVEQMPVEHHNPCRRSRLCCSLRRRCHPWHSRRICSACRDLP
jgi:hypothetical protein